MHLKKYQKGDSLIIKLIILFMFVAWVTVGIKVVPPFLDNMTVKTILKQVTTIKGIEEMDDGDIIDAFEKRFGVNGVSVVSGKDVKIEHDGGVLNIDLDYDVKVNVFRNIDAVIHFKNHYDSTNGVK